jgi:hypothetical protein
MIDKIAITGSEILIVNITLKQKYKKFYTNKI